jgi:hypothetical protein
MEENVVPQWHTDFAPTKGSAWLVPVKWLLDQVTQNILANQESMIFAVEDGKLYIKGRKPEVEETQEGPIFWMAAPPPRPEEWAEEFPPW